LAEERLLNAGLNTFARSPLCGRIAGAADPRKRVKAVVQIDTSRVPVDKLTRPDFLSLKAEMEQALANQKWIKAFCIHEAGHMIYLTQLGITQYGYIGPRIEYDDKRDAFDGFMVSIQPQSAPDITNADLSKFFITVAKAYAAGGTFAKKLTAAPDQGDQQDRENLNGICNKLEQKYSIVLDREASWKQGQEDVLKDLRSPEFCAKAWEKAREIERSFGF
jgi:hypothetical protein